MSNTALFEQRALPIIEECKQTFAGRGIEYGDTMKECQFVTLSAVCRELGINVPPRCLLAIAIAGLVDIKYIRSLGGWKEDNQIDGINYQAFLVGEMRALKAPEKPPIG